LPTPLPAAHVTFAVPDIEDPFNVPSNVAVVPPPVVW
jgi:hypothetical protein